MSSDSDSEQGARLGRSPATGAPAARRTSNAFGSPGTDSTVKRIDLHDQLIKHADATFQMRARGTAMRAAGIDDGDVLLVDRALHAKHGSVVIAAFEGELICRRLDAPATGRRTAAVVRLVADAGVTPIAITNEAPLEVWGVVTTIIKQLV